MSTCAFWSATQPAADTRATLKVSASARPGFSAPVVGSERMSERFSFSSTKYGPSVSAGRTMQDGVATAAPVVAAALAPALAAGAAVTAATLAAVVGVAAVSAPGAQ